MTQSSTKITVKNSPIHGRGVFASGRVSKGARLGTFKGRRTKRDGMYVLWVDDGEEIYGIRGENELRFLNHADDPNAEFDGPDLLALRPIATGAEVTIHYGEDWE
jgi:SET domain-containing protein